MIIKAVIVTTEWRSQSQSLLHKSQCNDSALHLSCRNASDGLKPHYFFFFLSQSLNYHITTGRVATQSPSCIHVYWKIDKSSKCRCKLTLYFIFVFGIN